jgi:hypothetical protein
VQVSITINQLFINIKPKGGHFMNKISSFRPGRSMASLASDLGLLTELSGTWEGQGFNLVARPSADNTSPLFLELNETFETLSFIPISSTIPNRGDAIPDIALFGLTYQQKIVDLVTQGALHIEPGIWIHVPSQDADGNQSVARMGNIPHGNSLLAQGIATALDQAQLANFNPNATSAVNTAPFPLLPTPALSPMPVPGTASGFAPFNLSDNAPAAVNFRTPAGNSQPVALPASILGVPMQQVINNPTQLLTAAIAGQKFKSIVAIRISTVPNLPQVNPNDPNSPTNVNFPGGGGGIENIPFLQVNADAATMFATFWIELVEGATPDEDFFQLQYVQTVFLNFPIIKPNVPPVPFTWPHVSVATLRKVFGGQ